MAKTIGNAKLAVAAPWDITTSDKSKFGTIHAAPGEGFVVPAKAKNVAGGLEFLRMMLSKESARKFAELTKSLPVVKGAADGLTISSALSSASKAAAEAPEVITWFYEGWYPTLQKAVGTQATELMAGRITPAQFMDEVQKAADAVAKDDKITKQKRTDA
jgi:N-acetylglucosamine transport system substrate-binding protein